MAMPFAHGTKHLGKAKQASATAPSGFRSRRTLLVTLLAAIACVGCAGYQVGPYAMFRSDIRTIYVPIVRNDTFRHDLGVRLTEALIVEIESRTPYKVVGNPTADSTLSARFVTQTKRVLTETSGDDPRALDAILSVQATWIDRQGTRLMENQLIPDESLIYTFTQGGRFVPEAGQPIETETQHAIDDLAQRIVSHMEMRW
ncbi:hypothetical protein FF011L_20220 [Roseimaritima multifibrata]|uniref:Lipopolysaccharide-assembly n=1 Tax=Roseimaritima multifibrata TaxID=1930274 RepID=A0A517MEE2_9BACT|nr:LptE family protein [Roseimaritima multifibrata]QDS93260.1 hypothetical protein FF011L_20220 [Roseimaritima multifibrata]